MTLKGPIVTLFSILLKCVFGDIPNLLIRSGVSRFVVLPPALPTFIRSSRFIMKPKIKGKKWLIFNTFLQSEGKTPRWYSVWWPKVEALPEWDTFFKLHVYERVGILLPEVYKRVGKSLIWANRWILWLHKVKKMFYFCDWFLFKKRCIFSS